MNLFAGDADIFVIYLPTMLQGVAVTEHSHINAGVNTAMQYCSYERVRCSTAHPVLSIHRTPIKLISILLPRQSRTDMLVDLSLLKLSNISTPSDFK
jgi:hypothetical protein